MKGVDQMYQVNDTVSYGTHGVCQIAEIGEKNLKGCIVKERGHPE